MGVPRASAVERGGGIDLIAELDIFQREMGDWGRPAPEELTDNPHDLAEAARLHLREKFLRAKVAVSGANFAAADTGTVVVAESEGNGRMCLTLPQTLITVMGIEKVLPSFADLDVFLQLLPRSSTGERPRPDRRRPDAAARRRRERCLAALRFDPVRCLLRRLPREDQHS
ncbi:Lactate utilization protein B [Streptomyces sp. enrichment culture]